MAIDRKIVPPEDAGPPNTSSRAPSGGGAARASSESAAAETQPLLGPGPGSDSHSSDRHRRRRRDRGRDRSRSGERERERGRSGGSDSEGVEEEEQEERRSTRAGAGASSGGSAASSRRHRERRRDATPSSAGPGSSTHSQYGAIAATSTSAAAAGPSSTAPVPYGEDDLSHDEPPPAYEPRRRPSSPSSQEDEDEDEDEDADEPPTDAEARRVWRRRRRIKRKRERRFRFWTAVGIAVLVVGGIVALTSALMRDGGGSGGRGREPPGPRPPQLVIPKNSSRIVWGTPTHEPIFKPLPLPWPTFTVYASTASVRIPVPHIPRPDERGSGIRSDRWEGTLDDVFFAHCTGSGYGQYCEVQWMEAEDEDEGEDDGTIEVRLQAQFTSVELRDSAQVWVVYDDDASHSSVQGMGMGTVTQKAVGPAPSFPNLPTSTASPRRRGILVATDPNLNIEPTKEVVAYLIEVHLPRRKVVGTLDTVMEAGDAIVEWNANVLSGNVKRLGMRGNDVRISFLKSVSALDSIYVSAESGLIEVKDAMLEAPYLKLCLGDGKLQAEHLRSSEQVDLSAMRGQIGAEVEAPVVKLKTDVGAITGRYNVSSSLTFNTTTGSFDAQVLAQRQRQRPRSRHVPWDEQSVSNVTIRGATVDGTVSVKLDQEDGVRLDSIINTTNGNIRAHHTAGYQGFFRLYTDTGELVTSVGPDAGKLEREHRFWHEDIALSFFRSALSRGRAWKMVPGRKKPPGIADPTWPDYGRSMFNSQRGQVRVDFD
ncbi:hypothetical protein OC834_000258 [Tilletia horrida]|nr:hypothetical protein OC834_000258 [Tilletia horrida]